MTIRVLCMGELMWDFHVPSGQSLVSTSDFHRVAGGAAANVACHLTSCDVRCAVGGVVSRDTLGQALCEDLEARGIDISTVQRAAGRTGLVFIDQVRPEQVRVVSYPPRYDEPTEHYPLPKDFECQAAAVLYIAAVAPDEVKLGALTEAAGRTREAGGRVVLDLNARPHAWRHHSLDAAATTLIAQADLVKASRGDLAVLGIPDGRHLGQLLRSGASAVVTDGSKPVQLLSPQGGLSFEPPGLSVRRSVGAGDAFDAGMIYRLLDGPWPQSRAAWREVLSQGYDQAAKHMTAATGPA